MQKLTPYAVLPFLVCTIIDGSLFVFDHSYRFLFYESLLCLILFKNWFANALLFSAVLLLKVLFIFFSINIFSLWFLTVEPAAIFVSVAALSISAIFLARNISILYFLVAFAAMSLVDKQVFRDQFATSILYTSYHSAVVRKAVPIDSTVYKILRESLLNGPTILINWESLGVPRDPQFVKKLQQRHPNLNYRAVHVSRRSTISSEFEYLCAQTFGKLDEQQPCLPSEQSSVALHGNFGFFLNRKNTYHSLGFQRSHFMDSIPGDTCFFSFRGKCDDAVFKNVIELGKRKDAIFIYALTLDSHFPYLKYANHAEEIWQEIANFLVAFDNAALSYNLIIVGDHPPPFSSEFYGDKVPLLYMQYCCFGR